MSCSVCKIKNERIETLKMHIASLQAWKNKHEASLVKAKQVREKCIVASIRNSVLDEAEL